ncbi:MAG: hypothetical protein ACTSP3_15305, partial [Candidatus Heimdallarchaeaceae archaeon]
MKAITTVFEIKKKYIPEKLYLAELKVDMKKLAIIRGESTKEMKDPRFSLNALIAHKLTRKYKEQIFSSRGAILISNKKIDADIVKKLIETDKTLQYKMQDSFLGLINQSEITKDDPQWKESCKRYISQFFKKTLFELGYIPIQFITQKKTYEWYKPIRNLNPQDKRKFSVLEISLPTIGNRDYSIRRCLKFQITDSEDGKWYLKTDLTSKISSKLSLLDLLKKYMESNQWSYEDVRNSKEIQKQIDNYFRRSLPELKPRYQNYEETGITQRNGYFVGINWEESISSCKHPRKIEGKSISILEYQRYIGNQIEDEEQPLVIFRYPRNQRTYYFPPELLEESPNFSFLKKIGASQSALEQTKPDEISRILMVLLLLNPLRKYIDEDPLIVEMENIENIFRIEKDSRDAKKVPLYNKHLENWKMMETGDFKKVGIIIPVSPLVTPKEDDTLQELLGDIIELTKKVLIQNNIISKEEIDDSIIKEFFSDKDNIADKFKKLKDMNCDIILSIITPKMKLDWHEIKDNSIEYEILNQNFILKTYMTKDQPSKKFYLRNLLYQMVFKCG